MSGDNFTCNAPQYFNFNNAEEDLNVDTYFELGAETQLEQKETVVEEKEKVFIMENVKSDSEEDHAEFFSPLDKTPAAYSNSAKLSLNKLRRSLSMCSIIHNTSENEKQDVAGAVIQTLETRKTKRNNSVDGMNNSLKKTSSQQHINRLAEPRRYKSLKNLNQNEFVSMAEATVKFQHGTPKRFRSQSKLCKAPLMPLTIPHSPKLATQGRYRPNTALSKEQQEIIKLEEIKKFKIRANPVNKKILREPFKIQPVEKKTTVFQPFHITEVKKKMEPAAPAQPIFQAKPVPKTLHNPRKIEIKSLPTTTAITPNFVRRLPKSSPKPKTNPVPVEQPNVPFKPTLTQPVPFSFEKRDIELKKKKESYIKKVLEDEKKAREFHAGAIPKKILRSRNSSAEKLNECAQSAKSSISGDESDSHVFRAKPAKVLTAKPFIPKKSDHVTEICEFNLTTEQRKVARDEFMKKVHEHNEEAEKHRQEQEELLKLKEQQDILEFRKQAEYKAQPVKKFKPVNVQPSNKITIPKSPNFHYEKRGKENHSH